MPKNIDVLLVEQEVVGDNKTALEAVVSANEELVKIRQEVALLQNANSVEESGGKDDEDDARREAKKREIAKRKLSSRLINTVCAVLVVFFILSVEFMIKWNNITTVNNIQGTGQILPVVVGGAGFIRTLWLLINEIIVRFVLGGTYTFLHRKSWILINAFLFTPGREEDDPYSP